MLKRSSKRSRQFYAWRAACMVVRGGRSNILGQHHFTNAVSKTNTTNCFSRVIKHATTVDDFQMSTAWTDLILQSTLRSHMSIIQQLLSSSHSFQVGFQGLLVRAEALLCLRP